MASSSESVRQAPGMSRGWAIDRYRSGKIGNNATHKQVKKTNEQSGDGRAIDSTIKIVRAVGRFQEPAAKEGHGSVRRNRPQFI
jgi:hypothetical protein